MEIKAKFILHFPYTSYNGELKVCDIDCDFQSYSERNFNNNMNNTESQTPLFRKSWCMKKKILSFVRFFLS